MSIIRYTEKTKLLKVQLEYHMVNVLKFLFRFANKILVMRAGSQKRLVIRANREYPDHTASSEAV